jgi:hypothetical protein
MNAATDTKNFADFKVADLALADWGTARRSRSPKRRCPA